MDTFKSQQVPQEKFSLFSKPSWTTNEIPVSQHTKVSGMNDWHLGSQLPVLPTTHFVGPIPPTSNNFGTNHLYTSTGYSSQPGNGLNYSTYNYTFPYSQNWNDQHGNCTMASQVSLVARTPPANPYSSQEINYSYKSPSNDSPISSPESLIDVFTDGQNNINFGSQSSLVQPPLSILDHNMNGNATSPPQTMVSSSYPTMSYTGNHAAQCDIKPLKKAIQMPQRKGGIQLWQFLYGLLMDSQHSNLIEWTSNRHVYEFRLLEPESIAVWWGTLKNKPTMTYDKFSRSLRYYYHKGILKKIPGERYVYQFLVDPEDMYKHIGTSDKRPAIKAMPKEAKMVMNMFQRKPTFISDNASRLPIVTEPPEGLQERFSSNNQLTL